MVNPLTEIVLLKPNHYLIISGIRTLPIQNESNETKNHMSIRFDPKRNRRTEFYHPKVKTDKSQKHERNWILNNKLQFYNPNC